MFDQVNVFLIELKDEDDLSLSSLRCKQILACLC